MELVSISKELEFATYMSAQEIRRELAVHLVTEREIEVRFEQSAPKRDVPRPANSVDHQSEDSELLRLYLACTPDERREIDLLADAKAAPLLKVVAEDKRAGVLEEARREAAWMFLAKKA